MSEEDNKRRQQRRAMRVLTLFNWGGVIVSVPLAIVASRLIDRGDDSVPGPTILFGILAFIVGIVWALIFYRRVQTPGLTRNEELRRLNQAVVPGGYAAILGVAIALLTSSAAVIVPFGAVAAINMTMLSRLGARVIDGT